MGSSNPPVVKTPSPLPNIHIFEDKMYPYKPKAKEGKMMITHLKSVGEEKKLHISHIHHYVSAYETTRETVDELALAIGEAISKAKQTHESQIVDQDGEMCLIIHPSGMIEIMIPWKSYEVESITTHKERK